MKNIVWGVRKVLYFPVEIFPRIGVPISVTLWITTVIVNLDAPLRAYMLRGR